MHEGSAAEPAEGTRGTRLASIDILRGFDMFWISGGTDLFIAIFAIVSPPIAAVLNVQFNHAVWSGFHFYDLIFSLFVFIAGLSIPFSVTKRLERGDNRRDLYIHIILRGFLLFGLGLVYNGFYIGFQYSTARFGGVLQRIGISSTIAGLLVMNSKPRTQILTAIAILLGYWAIMALIPVPGFGAGVFTPQGNLAGYVDRLLLPNPNAWCCYFYGDSEGILSTIPAVATCLLGVSAGHLLRSTEKGDTAKITLLVEAGVLCVCIALAWNFVFPINKYMWTSSFVMLTGGISFLLVALFFWIVDVKGFQKWGYIFQIIGRNSIFIYMFKDVMDLTFLGRNTPTTLVTLFLVVASLALRWAFLYWFDRKKWYFSV